MKVLKFIFVTPFVKIYEYFVRKNCEAGRHDLYEFYRDGRHWSIQDNYVGCRHCEYERFLGTKINYD